MLLAVVSCPALNRHLVQRMFYFRHSLAANLFSRGDIVVKSKQLRNFLSPGGHEASSDPAMPTRMIWGTTIDIPKTEEAIKDFFNNFKMEDKIRYRDGAEFDELLLDSQDGEPFYPRLIRQMFETEKWSLNLDCSNLLAYPKTRNLYHQLIRYPQEVIPLLDHVLKVIMMDMFEDRAEEINEKAITVRVFNTGRNVNMRELNPQDIDQLVTIKGLLTRSSAVIPDMKIALFQCIVCDTTLEVPLERGKVEEPTKCTNEPCSGRNTMKIIHNRCVFTDRQICRLQETPDDVPDGQTPQTVSLCMYDDLVDAAKAGDRLEVSGVYRAIPVRINGRQRTVKQIFRTYLDVIHVKRTDKKRMTVDKSIVNDSEYQVAFDESDQLKELDEAQIHELKELSQRPDIYNLLSASVAPSIYGLDDVKKGVLLQLFGAVNKFPGGTYGGPRIRGDINILIVGDPGVSKSQLLRVRFKSFRLTFF
jgi:DNA replication licensing factor MCM4